MSRSNKSKAGKRVYTPMEEEIRKIGRYNFPFRDDCWLEWDEENDSVVLRSNENIDYTKNYAVKSKEKRSVSPEPPKQEPQEPERECYIDLGEGLVKWDGKEYWKQVEGFESKYMVSTFGRIWNIKRDKELAGSKDRAGYLKVYLRDKGKEKNYFLHRLVARAFITNDSPETKKQINHIDEVKTNNRVDNLEYCTASYNTKYSIYKQEREVEQYDLKTNKVIMSFKSVTDAANILHCSKGSISKVCNGITNSYRGYGFRYTKVYGQYDNKRREVEKYDLKTGKVIKSYNSSVDAARELDLGDTKINCAGKAIRDCCKEEIPSYKGFGWRYKD